MKKIFFGLVVLTILIPFINVSADSSPQIGDLRCPTTLDTNVKCYPHTNSAGVVTSVDLVYSSTTEEGELEITKTVTKKMEQLGHYDVQFKVKGKDITQKKTAGKVYVAMIIDVSVTASGIKDKAKKAAATFARTLIPDSENDISNYYIKLIQFATKAKVQRDFKNRNFGENISYVGGLKTKSYIDEALKLVQFPSDAEQKYIFIFGDGRYWSSEDTNPKTAVNLANKFKQNGVKIYGIRYKGSCQNSKICRVSSKSNARNAGCKLESTYMTCDTTMMKKLLSDNAYFDANNSNLDQQFKDIADLIKEDVGDSASSVSSSLTDNIGDDFNLTDDTGSYQQFNVGRLSEEGWTSPKFEIEIDQYAKGNEADGGGWHETNENFNFKYTDGNNKEHVVGVDTNPEVYWKPYATNLHTCHSTSISGTVREDESDDNQYFKKSCKEGYMENGVTKNGFTVEAIVNNLNTGVRNFNVSFGMGIPATLKFSTNVMCTYEFDSEKFNARYEELKLASTSTDPYEVASATKELTKLNEILKNYLELNVKTDLTTYANNFEKQSAALTIHYNGSSDYDVVNYENINGTVKKNINCSNSKSALVNNQNIVVSQKCNATFSKEMQMEGSCLDMQTGEQESCSSESNSQLTGGNKFYTNMKQNSGYITIKIPNAGYKQNLDVELRDNGDDNKPECEFSAQKSNIQFRQIDLKDPFLKNYEPGRGIGKNYLNNMFNFEKIIHADVWEGNYTYNYTLSKVNVNNIKKDTAEDRANSYLGKNCYFNGLNKYVCDFTRNGNSNLVGNNKLFNTYDIKEDE